MVKPALSPHSLKIAPDTEDQIKVEYTVMPRQ
jgi:hypothetical protein